MAVYGLQGLGGTQLITAGTGVNRDVIDRIPGGYGNALSSLFATDYPRWTVQLNFSYPLGMSSQEASVARARVQLNQVQAQLKQIELQVATDVTNAAIDAQNSAEGVQAAQAARELAQRQLEAEQSKFEVGMSTNYFVVQAQRDLADAQNSELRAVLNYRKSLVELERAAADDAAKLEHHAAESGWRRRRHDGQRRRQQRCGWCRWRRRRIRRRRQFRERWAVTNEPPRSTSVVEI